MFLWNCLAFGWSNGFWQFDLFSKSRLNIWKFSVYVLLKPGLENFEHCFASVWDECNCVVLWAFFVIAFLWDWNENGPFPVENLIHIMRLSGARRTSAPWKWYINKWKVFSLANYKGNWCVCMCEELKPRKIVWLKVLEFKLWKYLLVRLIWANYFISLSLFFYFSK